MYMYIRDISIFKTGTIYTLIQPVQNGSLEKQRTMSQISLVFYLVWVDILAGFVNDEE